MRKHLLLPALMCLFTAAFSQEPPDVVITASKQTTKELTPQQVIDSLKKRFPNAKSVQYFQTPQSSLKAGWTIDEEDNLDLGDDLDTYTISFKRSDFQYYALFDAHGNLLMMKYEEYDTKLPQAVRDTIAKMLGASHVNYKLVSKTHYKKENKQKKKEFYEVIIVSKTDKNDQRTFIVSPTGEIMKEKDKKL
jgi:hypothetical protein